jgi:hypothetical protein
MRTVALSVVLCAFATRPRLVAIAGSARAGSSPVSSTLDGPGRFRRSRACPATTTTGRSAVAELVAMQRVSWLGGNPLDSERDTSRSGQAAPSVGQAFRYEASDES